QKQNRAVKNNLDSSTREELAKRGSSSSATTTSNSSRGAAYRGKRHTRVSEKYYDCLQCAEQCRHTNLGTQSAVNPTKKLNNRNNNNNSGVNNNSSSSSSNNRKNKAEFNSARRGSDEIVEEGQSRELVSPTRPTSSSVMVKNLVQMNKNRRKITRISGCFGVDEYCKRKKVRSLEKNTKKLISRGLPTPGELTPAKKRSSLARPVKVHDSFAQAKRPMSMIECHSERSTARVLQRQSNSQDSGTTGCEEPLEDREDDENSWPIKLRLEEMLELTLSRGKRTRRIRTSKRKKMILTSKYGHFKDTERLLKVLSVNNVDQDNRYNVKRCSVM
ncbi:uncharacterized protein, partial [Venturia canescens]|uniref:uncharacterized protein n=1 Tax=Venturia canescens TaxID=32260 RepID=UPI001C9D6189